MTEMHAFQHKVKEFSSFSAKSRQEYFQKWGMLQMSVQMYSYDLYFDVNEKDRFVEAFFKDRNVQQTLKTFVKQRSVLFGNMQFKDIFVEILPKKVTSMNFFDVIFNEKLVYESGSIKKCFDEMIDDILVSDELRKMILTDESEYYGIFQQKDRNEFIFQVFQHLVIGGYCCQYEDNINPYIETTKYIYKDLLHVNKDVNTKNLVIGSIVLKVKLLGNKENQVFPGTSNHMQNFCYLIINPEKRNVIVWHHMWDV